MRGCREGCLFVYNSPGGSVTAGLAIYDTMQFIKPDVATTCMGWRPRWALSFWPQAPRGNGRLWPNSRIMIHQPMAGAQGQITDIEIMTKEFSNTKKRLNELLVVHTGSAAR